MAANDFFDNGPSCILTIGNGKPSQTLNNIVVKSKQKSVSSNVVDNTSHACSSSSTLKTSLQQSLAKNDVLDYFFLGKRVTSCYSLSSGYLVRCQNIKISLEESSRTSFANKSNKFSGGKIMVETYVDNKFNESCSNARNIRCRLPNKLCHIMLPLLRLKLIDVRGHIWFDVGQISTFTDFYAMIYIFIRRDLLEHLNSKESSYLVDHFGDNIVEQVNAFFTWVYYGDMGLELLEEPKAETIKSKF